ncbi:MAG: proline/glycine betaine ABC transporter permease [Candidatus Pelagibacter sp. TMED263]|jgi:glycine betaine/proline transport system permease protein|nr:MAG: proline/glycine betaine ABC transporter permease [Candidatus Pelagibacter sp. TMED263]|tara:strand:- start:758 stop:1648 length:891 start_codon:yes stop_codon:yes gene_type:complete
MKNYFLEFPEMPTSAFRAMKKGIDSAYKSFAREYGDLIDALFDPLLSLLVFFEDLLVATPWPIFLAVLLALTYWGSRSYKLVIFTFLAFMFIGYFRMWDETMSTIAIILTSVIISIAIGIPTGIAMSRSNRTQSIVIPILDVMQTMPPFVYLIPIVMLMGIGKIPGLIAVVIYAIPPLIRLTNLGIREVDKDALEAADAYGTTPWQKLTLVQMPLALPTIFAGINQTIMMALAMIIIASMIGVKGLGQPVLQSIYNQYFTKGVLYGLAIVIVAVVFDRVSQSYGQRIQKHRSGKIV